MTSETGEGTTHELGGGAAHESGGGPAHEFGGGATPESRGGTRRFIEDKFPRGLVIRLFVYLIAGHFFAFFVYLLFVLGGRNQ
ncbi:DUF6126 family protein [Streptomyces sp. N35]|uniref:DUF6126 family protein n=1 Tax=Streptomyces sp. N35 TaxID=2795730 RepID=UPI001F424114